MPLTLTKGNTTRVSCVNGVFRRKSMFLDCRAAAARVWGGSTVTARNVATGGGL